ncbi:hypothetical protein GQ55_6G293700 [Panicum hallii var. hallii]|uniref:ABC transporter domain-containing protein n=1 Tax=Panicum hallii var. hallii TaxID=1504633 RepID=A0A2T7DB08_9POAL|nr:hypothetical protein GQ55_6G293700 [Panicum hallii var. hallii]
MVSDASKKKAAAAAKRGAKAPVAPSSSSKGAAAAPPKSIDAVAALNLSDRTCTGVLASHPLSRDIHKEKKKGARTQAFLSVLYSSLPFIKDIRVYSDQRIRHTNSSSFRSIGNSSSWLYPCLLGTTYMPPLRRHPPLLSETLMREYLHAAFRSDRVLSLMFHGHDLIVDSELELNYGRRYGLLGLNGCGKSTLLTAVGCRELPIPEHMDIYHLTREIEASDMSALQAVVSCDEERVKLEKDAEILAAQQMQAKKTRDFSGGRRMRIALARALFMNRTILLLDEPTNHLDLEGCVWLEETLKKFDRILVVISHSQDFLNGVCTNIIHMQNKKLKLYTGNYDQYVQTRCELEENQMKQYRWEQEQIASMKEYIARFGHGSGKLARQAQSKEKTLAKMERGGLTEKVVRDKSAGKSTLLKLMTGELSPLDGMVRRHNHLRIAQFHQHLAEKLDLDMSALEYMVKEYPGNGEERMRAAVGKFGLPGKAQVMPMRNLSDGQRSRVIFAWLACRQPQLLLLDEPTNHLDIETIDSLAEVLNEWDGGVVLVSHDFRLINQVALEIWVCEKQAVTRWEGSCRRLSEEHDYYILHDGLSSYDVLLSSMYNRWIMQLLRRSSYFSL